MHVQSVGFPFVCLCPTSSLRLLQHDSAYIIAVPIWIFLTDLARSGTPLRHILTQCFRFSPLSRPSQTQTPARALSRSPECSFPLVVPSRVIAHYILFSSQTERGKLTYFIKPGYHTFFELRISFACTHAARWPLTLSHAVCAYACWCIYEYTYAYVFTLYPHTRIYMLYFERYLFTHTNTDTHTRSRTHAHAHARALLQPRTYDAYN